MGCLLTSFPGCCPDHSYPIRIIPKDHATSRPCPTPPPSVYPAIPRERRSTRMRPTPTIPKPNTYLRTTSVHSTQPQSTCGTSNVTRPDMYQVTLRTASPGLFARDRISVPLPPTIPQLPIILGRRSALSRRSDGY